MQVSRAVAALDDEITKWRERPLGEIQDLLLDARQRVKLGKNLREAVSERSTSLAY